eukprot:3725594-Prorocentrum_lima.AAC.1
MCIRDRVIPIQIASAYVSQHVTDNGLHAPTRGVQRTSGNPKHAGANTCLLYTSPSPRDSTSS